MYCSLNVEEYTRWQIKTYQTVMAAYQKADMDDEEALAVTQIRQSGTVAGENPALNRQIEREELKALCIQLWAGNFPLLPEGHYYELEMYEGQPLLNRDAAAANSARVEFFEESFPMVRPHVRALSILLGTSRELSKR